jgi:hypothetical protein
VHRVEHPASVQSRSRRQQVNPGASEHLARKLPVLSTNTIPANAARSSTGNRPGYLLRPGARAGNNGSTRCHKLSGTNSSITRTAGPHLINYGQTRRATTAQDHKKLADLDKHPSQRALEGVELRGFEPLTPTLPV